MFSELAGLAVGTLVVAVVLIISFLIIQQGQDQTVDYIASQTVTNETVTWINNTVVPFANRNLVSASCSIVSDGVNNTAFLGLNSGNYTCDADGITVTNATGPLVQLSATVNVTYSFQPKSTAYNATQTLANGTADIPGWIPLIILAVIGSMLLGLVSLFAFRKFN